MKASNVLPMLTDLKMDPNTWEYSDELYSIILTTDLNQNLYPGVDMLYFDTVNELLKIKRFTPVISGNMVRFNKDSDGKVFTSLKSKVKYRTIRPGDFVYILTDNGLQRDGENFLFGKVSAVTYLGDRVQVAFEGNFAENLPNAGFISYSEYNYNNIEFGNGTGEHFKLFGGESYVVKMIPMSDFVWDICYDFDKISGFGMQTATEVW